MYAGLLGVGVIALAMDRLVFSPAPAEAADEPAALLVSKPAAPASGAGNSSTNAVAFAAPVAEPVTYKLKALADSLHLDSAPVKDAFAPSRAWAGKSGGIASDTRSFEQSHQLSGVMLSGRHPSAMIDGKLLTVGQSLDGYKLVSVTPGSATFQAGDLYTTLRNK